MTIAYGCGASLLDWEDSCCVYIDLPKNEIQYRARAKTIWNLGQAEAGASSSDTYKRFYFVDWPVLNKHKAKVALKVDAFIDAQDPDNPVMVAGNHLRHEIGRLAETVFRVRLGLSRVFGEGSGSKERFQASILMCKIMHGRLK